MVAEPVAVVSHDQFFRTQHRDRATDISKTRSDNGKQQEVDHFLF